MIALMLKRLSVRYDKVMRQPRIESIVVDGQVVTRFMPTEDRQRLNQWFSDRYNYLEEQYRLAINASDNIIGKQYIFDQRYKLNTVSEAGDLIAHR